MELIGKKVKRNSITGFRMNVHGTKITLSESIRLTVGNYVGIAYNQERNSAYLFSTDASVGYDISKGTFTSKFHANMLKEWFTPNSDNFTLSVSNVPDTFSEYQDINFYQLTLNTDTNDAEN